MSDQAHESAVNRNSKRFTQNHGKSKFNNRQFNIRRQTVTFANITFEHIREICPTPEFASVNKKITPNYFILLTKANEKNLKIRVTTSVRRKTRHYNKMEISRKTVVDILFDGESIRRWRQYIEWRGDGREFIEELTKAVGAAHRLRATETVSDDQGFYTLKFDAESKRQFFENKNGQKVQIKPALLKFV